MFSKNMDYIKNSCLIKSVTFSMPHKNGLKKSRTGIDLNWCSKVIPIPTDWTCHCMEPKGLHPLFCSQIALARSKNRSDCLCLKSFGRILFCICPDEDRVRLSSKCSQKESKKSLSSLFIIHNSYPWYPLLQNSRISFYFALSNLSQLPLR